MTADTPRPLVVRPADLRSFRLRPTATNRLVPVLAAGAVGGSLSMMFEIFDLGGAQEPNRHEGSDEIFYFVAGEGRAHCGDETLAVAGGDVLVIPAGSTHFLENTGSGRLYGLSILVADDGSHDAGARPRLALEDEDVAVLSGLGTAGADER